MAPTNNNKYGSLSLLGRPVARYPDEPSPNILETFRNEYASRRYLVTFDCPEFTSICPVTGQPDFATIKIEYVPDTLCIETKSLKFYLASYRNTRSFNEEIANRILEDFVTACSPREVMVHAEFAARGGIRLSVIARHPDNSGEYAHQMVGSAREKQISLHGGSS
ncbi:MAG: NADPH-dependent 7-cyano-7-deazaguanine reductase QueF [Verrucomicrobia bacterium]|nr:NADPH-dependent 7-cyano-7-deazaguanine reductase QueF [Verrucomicrobiota bacterium]MBV9671362.1 NADPH-dependent 7-cyano-7-deazaguanine reductase QueF [Verrucomicrobiota bacterium]